MNHSEMIAVIQAHKEGKTLEFRYKREGGYWEAPRSQEFGWDFHAFDYRVKPEPREWTLRRSCSDHRMYDDALAEHRCPHCEIIRVREVLNAPSVSNGNEVRNSLL